MVADRISQSDPRSRQGSPRACGWARRTALAGVWLAMAAGACQNDGIVDPEVDEESGPFVLSDPAAGALSATAAAPRSAGAEAQANIVYVSLPTGTVADGKLAVITHVPSGMTARTAMTDGGFDPVPILAEVGDSVQVDIELTTSATPERRGYAAPRVRRPIVIRVDPPPRKRDVPLNAPIVVVFSEPLDGRTVTSETVRLERAGVPVGGRVVLASTGLRAAFQPDEQLAPNTTYTLVITDDLRDRTGDRLEQATATEFTTGNSAATAMAYTDGAALLAVEPGQYRTSEFSAFLLEDGTFSGTFDVFNPAADQGRGLWVSGSVVCFAIEEGNLVWMAGVIEASSDPDFVGLDGAWRAIDRGPPEGGTPDLLSLGILTLGPGGPEGFCADRETAPVIPALFPLERGDIVVRPPVAGPPEALAYTMPPSNALVNVAIHPPVRVAVVDGSGSTVTSFGGPVTIAARDAAGAPVELFGTTTVPAQGGVAAFPGVGVARPGAGYAITATAAGLPALESGPFDAVVPRPGWIAFSVLGDVDARDEDGLFVMRSDLSQVTRISRGPDVWPAWSPDGTRLAFHRWIGDSTWIHLMDPDGTNAVQRAYGRAPAWSPDGTRLAFVSDRDSVEQFDLYVTDADGTERRIAAVGPLTRPSWSPDGTRVVFAAGTDSTGNLFIAQADEPDVSLLLDMTALATCVARDPAWSPVGEWIAFQVACSEDRRGIYLIRSDGTGLTRITTRPSRHPQWAPDGTQIVFDRGFEGFGRCYSDLWLINADGSGETRLDLSRQAIGCSRMPTWRRP